MTGSPPRDVGGIVPPQDVVPPQEKRGVLVAGEPEVGVMVALESAEVGDA